LDQARALAQQLAGRCFEAVYSSDLKRAASTAQVLADMLALPVQLDRRLREINLGEWEGMLVNDILRRYPEEYRELHEHPENSRVPGGESVSEVTCRMASAADEIARCHQNGSVLVASHGMAVAALYCFANRIPLARVYQYLPENAQPVVIDWNIRPPGTVCV